MGIEATPCLQFVFKCKCSSIIGHGASMSPPRVRWYDRGSDIAVKITRAISFAHLADTTV
eukprot:3709523-Alexandrium_andersonii.AAC.1